MLFLDEPTTGLDPRGRAEVWESIRALVAGGTTVLLTTQYLDEADQLADTICVIDAGRVIADGTPDHLKAAVGGDRIDVVVRDAGSVPVAATVVARVSGSPPSIDPDARRISAPVSDRITALTEVVRALDAAGVVVDDLLLRRPSLDDVFLRLTGRRTDEDSTSAPGDSTTGATTPTARVHHGHTGSTTGQPNPQSRRGAPA